VEHAVVWFSFKTVVIGGLLLALAIFVLGMCFGLWLGRSRDWDETTEAGTLSGRQPCLVRQMRGSPATSNQDADGWE
jgi:hypothetical protein